MRYSYTIKLPSPIDEARRCVDNSHETLNDEETNQLPQPTTVIQAKPWADDHVAHFISTRAASNAPKSRRVITAKVLKK